MLFLPINADTSMIKDDPGKWKFVIIASTILNSNPG
jgi:hypothetical protein